MTLEKAIFQVDELKPNQVSRAQKIEWLSHLDRRVFKEVISAHEPDAQTPSAFTPYNQDTPPDTELLALPPYDDIYPAFLSMQIDLTNLEYDKYNNSLLLFTSAWGQFARAYHREHRFRQDARTLKF
ncbi:MAG: hypothetical protein IJI53_13945 [Clostridia bacterium]|nr:hypothetical protein [Clostridia bacterium]MBR0409130.1 hypothetical protein [Clostridia bacterium]